MSSARSKGLDFCREVKGILKGMGHGVEGPGYATAFFQGTIHPIHRDYFGLFDLISFFEGQYFFHQVSTIENKSTKIKSIQAKGMAGWVWCRVNEDNQTGFDVFEVYSDFTVEKEMRYFIKRAKKDKEDNKRRFLNKNKTYLGELFIEGEMGSTPDY